MTKGSARIALAVVGYDSRGSGDGFNPTFGGRVSATLTKVTTKAKPLTVTIGGKGGVPGGNLDAALLLARVDSVSLPKKVTSATLYATVAGNNKRTAVAMIFPHAQNTVLLVARPGRGGKVTFSLSTGSAKIVVNEFGTWASPAYTQAHANPSSLRFGHVTSAVDEFDGKVGSSAKIITVRGLPRAGVSSLVLQVSVDAGRQTGEVQLVPTGARFGAGSVSYLPNVASGQLVAVAPDALGRISLRLSKGVRTVHVALVGYTSLS